MTGGQGIDPSILGVVSLAAAQLMRLPAEVEGKPVAAAAVAAEME